MPLRGWARFQRVAEAARHLWGTLSGRSRKILGRSQIGGGFIHAQDLLVANQGSVPPRELRRTPVEPIPLRRTGCGAPSDLAGHPFRSVLASAGDRRLSRLLLPAALLAVASGRFSHLPTPFPRRLKHRPCLAYSCGGHGLAADDAAVRPV